MYALIYAPVYPYFPPWTFRISLARTFVDTEEMAQSPSAALPLSKEAKISTKEDASASEQ